MNAPQLLQLLGALSFLIGLVVHVLGGGWVWADRRERVRLREVGLALMAAGLAGGALGLAG